MDHDQTYNSYRDNLGEIGCNHLFSFLIDRIYLYRPKRRKVYYILPFLIESMNIFQQVVHSDIFSMLFEKFV